MGGVSPGTDAEGASSRPFTVTKRIGCIYLAAAIPGCTRSRDHGHQSTLLTKVSPPLTSRMVPVT